MNIDSKNDMQQGAVTLLDILGWKGIWKRNDKCIDNLLQLIELANDRIKLIFDQNHNVLTKFKDLDIQIKSISDTIALITYGDVNSALEFHTLLNCLLVAESIRKDIPLRGATAYGDFSIINNIMAGPAIDEVAAWYEVANWIGVIYSPSALFQVDIEKFISNGSRFIVEHDVPTKNFGKYRTYCSNWTKSWMLGGLGREELLKCFLNSSPITPDVYIKFKNTLDFYDSYEKYNEQIAK